MKVALIYPYVRDVYHKLGFLLPPLGLGYLAATSHSHGHEIEIIDLNLTEDKALPDLRAFDVIGISMDTTRYNRAREIAQAARKLKKTIVVGGPHATFVEEELLKDNVANYVVRGEGELAFLSLLDSLEKSDGANDVAGLSFMKGTRFFSTPERAPLDDLDSLPFPDRDALQIERYRKLTLGGRHITSMITSRGCPYNCSFCSSTKFSGSAWRHRSALNIVDEIEVIVKKYEFGAVCFLDDNFTLNPIRVIEVCQEILRRSIDIYWWCFSRGDIIIKNEEMVKEMARSGCRYVFMGIESASENTLAQYGKKTRLDDSLMAIELLKSYGIETMGSFIIGWPDDTKKKIKKTIALSKRIGLGGAQFSILTPYPGTELYEKYRDRIFEKNWEKFDCHHSVMSLDRLNSKTIERYLKLSFFSFYFTPRRILNAILSPFRGRGVGFETIKKLWEYFRGK